MKNEPENFIFDWSGTISDDLHLVYRCAMKVFSELGLDELSLEEYKHEFVLPYMDFYRKFTDTPRQKLEEIFIKEYTGKRPELYPGAAETINALRQKGKKLIIFSASPQETLEEEARHYGIHDLFSAIHGSSLDKTRDIEKIMASNRLKPENTAYVGDMVHDIDAGKVAGVTTIAVTWGYNSRDRLEKADPDHLIDELGKIHSIFQ